MRVEVKSYSLNRISNRDFYSFHKDEVAGTSLLADS